jgi:hypothetical protein
MRSLLMLAFCAVFGSYGLLKIGWLKELPGDTGTSQLTSDGAGQSFTERITGSSRTTETAAEAPGYKLKAFRGESDEPYNI